MGKARANTNGDVQWFLFPKDRKPFAYSTKATSDLIKVLYEQYGDLREVYNAIHFDEQAKKIVKKFIYSGIYKV